MKTDQTALYAPVSFIQADPEMIRLEVNGCGTDGWKGQLVPETFYGLNISEACNIHDWMYLLGKTIADKEEADRVFLNNLLRLIDDRTRWCWLKWLRRRRALKYYQAVKHFGGPAFWAEKNPKENLLKSL